MSLEAPDEEGLTMGKSISENVRPTACTGPPKRLAHFASHASVPMGAPGVVALLKDMTNSEATISKGEGTSEQYTTTSRTRDGTKRLAVSFLIANLLVFPRRW